MVFRELVFLNIWLAAEVGAFETSLTFEKVLLLKVVISNRPGRLQSPFEVIWIFRLFNHDLLVNILPFLNDALPLLFIVNIQPFIHLFGSNEALWVWNYKYPLWISCISNVDFVIKYDSSNCTSSHVFYFVVASVELLLVNFIECVL